MEIELFYKTENPEYSETKLSGNSEDALESFLNLPENSPFFLAIGLKNMGLIINMDGSWQQV